MTSPEKSPDNYPEDVRDLVKTFYEDPTLHLSAVEWSEYADEDAYGRPVASNPVEAELRRVAGTRYEKLKHPTESNRVNPIYLGGEAYNGEKPPTAPPLD